jgi:hypothetical protein
MVEEHVIEKPRESESRAEIAMRVAYHASGGAAGALEAAWDQSLGLDIEEEIRREARDEREAVKTRQRIESGSCGEPVHCIAFRARDATFEDAMAEATEHANEMDALRLVAVR